MDDIDVNTKVRAGGYPYFEDVKAALPKQVFLFFGRVLWDF